MNPNNCATCEHKKHPDGGWCYMFRNEPTSACAQHTARRVSDNDVRAVLSFVGWPNAASTRGATK